MTVAEPVHDADPGLTRTWLAHLYGEVDTGWLTLFALDRGNGDRNVIWQPVDELDALTDDAMALAEHGCVWFGVATRRARTSGRGSAEDCAELPGLWLDIDVAGPNHKGGQPLPPTMDAARQLLRAFPLEPTAVVASGGGLQAWWLFREPLAADDEAAALLARWGHTWATHGRERGWHVDNVFDLARIMRLPGTLNRKQAAIPVTVVEADFDRRFNPDDLDQYTTEPPPSPQPSPRVPYIGPERPGDAFNAARTGSDVLAMAGFVLAKRDHQGEHWTGPWKDVRQGTSATVYSDGHTTIWSDTALGRWPSLDLRRPYDPFGLYCVLFHGGRWSEAREAVTEAGYGARNMRDDDFSWVALDGENDQADDDVWEDPAPLHAPEPAAFPIDVLPDWMAAHCVDVADQMQVPVDLCAQVALGAWAAACAGHVLVAITASWRTDVNVYLATAVLSGGGKSPVTNAFTRPLFELEATQMANAAADIARATAERKVYERQKAEAEKSGDVDRMQLAILALEAHTVPRPPRLVGDDSTPERLTELVAEQGGRFAVISSEGAVFDIASGMYSSAGRKTNLDIYLKGWSGDRVIVDRKGSGDRAGTQLVINRPVLTVAITVQPAALSELRKHPELAGRGFTARFMYSVPRDLLGRRRLRRVVEVDATASAERYDERFGALAARMAGWESNLVHLGPAALDAFLDWRQSHEEHLGEGGSLERLAEWVAKLHGTVPRVAVLLHLADGQAVGDAVSPATMARALRLGDYWLSHALVVADIWSLDDTLEGARKALQRLVAKGTETISERDAWIANRTARYPAVSDFRPVLTLLEDYGWIRKVLTECEQSRAGRKPSPRYVLHPHAKRLMDAGSARSARDPVAAVTKYSTLYRDTPSQNYSAHNAQNSGDQLAPGDAPLPVDPPSTPGGSWLLGDPGSDDGGGS